MTHRFTDPYGRRWHVDTHHAGDGRLEFTARPPRPVLRPLLRFTARTLVIAVMVYLVPLVLIEDQQPLDALVLGLLIGAMASTLLTIVSALLRLRTPSEPLVFSAPFPLRADLSDAELFKAIQVAEQMRDHPDHTGPIELRAVLALALRQETA